MSLGEFDNINFKIDDATDDLYFTNLTDENYLLNERLECFYPKIVYIIYKILRGGTSK